LIGIKKRLKTNQKVILIVQQRGNERKDYGNGTEEMNSRDWGRQINGI
jgi:hypothetical protein